METTGSLVGPLIVWYLDPYIRKEGLGLRVNPYNPKPTNNKPANLENGFRVNPKPKRTDKPPTDVGLLFLLHALLLFHDLKLLLPAARTGLGVEG